MTPLSLLLLLVKSLCVFALSGLALLALRRASAASRHLVCLLTLCALLALPLLWWTPFSLPVSMRLPVQMSQAHPLAPSAAGEEPNPPAPFPKKEGGVRSSEKASDNFPNPSLLGRGGEERAGVGFSGSPHKWLSGRGGLLPPRPLAPRRPPCLAAPPAGPVGHRKAQPFQPRRNVPCRADPHH